jgi:hypothetical protein
VLALLFFVAPMKVMLMLLVILLLLFLSLIVPDTVASQEKSQMIEWGVEK